MTSTGVPTCQWSSFVTKLVDRQFPVKPPDPADNDEDDDY